MAETSHIIEWQKAVSPERDVSEPPLIADLYKVASELYSGILEHLVQNPSHEKPILLSLQRSHSYLVLWADGFSVSSGSLDASLDKSRRARRSTLRLLFSICQTLTKRLLPLLPQNEQALLHEKSTSVTHKADKLNYLTKQDETVSPDSDTDSDTSSTFEAAELEEVAEDLKTDTECLLDLGSRFGEKTVGPVITETAVDVALLSAWDPSKNFIDRVRWRFPECPASLAEKLGRANWTRVLNYQERKSTNSRPQQTMKSNLGAASQTGSGDMASTTFHDSALGSSIPSASSRQAASLYAETLISYSGGQGESVRIPSLPDGAEKGVPFVCLGCGQKVVVTNKSAWKKHLFLDLQPYLCVDVECNYSTTPFSTRNEWENHLTEEHDLIKAPNGLGCPICQDKSFGGPIQMRTHLARHLEEIALTILPTNLDSEDGTDIDSGLASSETASRAHAEEEAKKIPSARIDQAAAITGVMDLIQADLLGPLLLREDLEAFQETILQIRERMHVGMVLRDVEVILITNARESAPTPELYQKFSLLVLETIRGILPHFGELGTISAGEQPYNEEYLINAERQVRRDARQMKDALGDQQSKATRSNRDNDKNWCIAISSEGQNNEADDYEDYESSLRKIMATKRERDRSITIAFDYECPFPGCEKFFKRPSDATKHEKTHSRPWKCPIPTCKYHDLGWPTEKEMDRHIADKHSEKPTIYECEFQPCPYKSKRESNCKQHMEKAHGWTYVRTKHHGNKRKNVEMPAHLDDKQEGSGGFKREPSIYFPSPQFQNDHTSDDEGTDAQELLAQPEVHAHNMGDFPALDDDELRAAGFMGKRAAG